MRLGCIAVLAHALYLGFQKAYAFGQLVLGIGRQIFLRQPAGGIAFRAGKIAFIHRNTVSQATTLAVNDAAR